ncbi:MAG: hypothetical protein CTY12_01200 [Methylotenera sp.]|nr:MAG: hypothetical protein CTY12_01200 [Methylotenera sp.]
MEQEIQEALQVVKSLFKDVTDSISNVQSDITIERDLTEQRREDLVERMLPDFSSTTFLQLVKLYPGFAERHYVAEMFEKFQPKRFMLFWKKAPKLDDSSLSIMKVKFHHWLIDNDSETYSELDDLVDTLEVLKLRQTKLAELMTILTALKSTNKPLPDNIKQQLVNIRQMSNNYPNHPISDDYYFTEDWDSIFDLATQLFIVYEAFQSEALAEELIPEQLLDQVENAVDNSTEVVDNTSNQESIATNDSLGYFS